MERLEVNRLMRNLDDYLGRIAGGDSFVLTQYGRDVAILSPTVSNPAFEPTDHVPDAKHVSPLMRKILEKGHEGT